MSIYESLGIETIINASDTYTRIGGSRMSEKTLSAMREAAGAFADLGELSTAICADIAGRTGNEAAFISSGAGACLVLTVSATMAGEDERLQYALPNAALCPKNEVIVFASQKNCAILPYWHLIELSGARLIEVEDSIEALNAAISEKTASVVLFAGTVYEWTTPEFSDVIAAAHRHDVPVIVDAAAQLPPKSLFSYYTKTLGADVVIFSGGKFISGPQTTGIALGRREIIKNLKPIASPNVRIGRPYKVGKEEYAGLHSAVVELLESDEDAAYNELRESLERILAALNPSPRYSAYIEEAGRLGQQIPMLYLQFLDGTTGNAAYDFLYAAPCRIDIGRFSEGDPTGDMNRIFVNAINLRAHEIEPLIAKLNRFLEKQ